jgi:hypothetical protein
MAYNKLYFAIVTVHKRLHEINKKIDKYGFKNTKLRRARKTVPVDCAVSTAFDHALWYTISSI